MDDSMDEKAFWHNVFMNMGCECVSKTINGNKMWWGNQYEMPQEIFNVDDGRRTFLSIYEYVSRSFASNKTYVNVYIFPWESGHIHGEIIILQEWFVFYLFIRQINCFCSELKTQSKCSFIVYSEKQNEKWPYGIYIFNVHVRDTGSNVYCWE